MQPATAAGGMVFCGYAEQKGKGMNAIYQMRRMLLLLTAVLFSLLAASCDDTPEVPNETDDRQPIVIEEGINQHAAEEELSGEEEEIAQEESGVEFEDKGEATTVEDLIAAQAKISSFYFEQTVAYPNGHVFLQVWYKDENMRLFSSQGGYGMAEEFYDYETGTVISHQPGSDEPAEMYTFDKTSPDAPDNPVMNDYSAYTLLGGEEIDHQYCLILEAPNGDLVWVSTKYGFPLQTEYTDSLGDRLTTKYKNISINTVTDEDVLPPADLEVYDYDGN